MPYHDRYINNENFKFIGQMKRIQKYLARFAYNVTDQTKPGLKTVSKSITSKN